MYRDQRDRAAVAFTDRHGGVSASPFDSLNLGAAAGDRTADVERNLVLAVEAFGADPAQVARMNQVHGRDVAVVRAAPAAPDRPRADGMVTDQPGLTLVVRVADCVPVLLADPRAGLVGCAHAGRPGLAAGVVPRTVEALRELGAQQLTAWVGPHVCGTCYEVPEQMQADVGAFVPEAVATTAWGTPSLDLGAGVRAQLLAAGCEVVDAACCTRESPDLYSYRRDGEKSGRSAGLVRLLPEASR
ncbi:MAG: peptidoglycan editing factor PgeF [Propionibacteriales bacterium]|nr:peptidoglycan editing factor PgeF [Propionibacteriales bacterium]